MTDVWTRERVCHLLATDDRAVVRAIKQLYARQTAGEREVGATTERNGRGFNARDAEFLTSVAQALPRWRDQMTPKQLAVARKMLPKYWRQLLGEIAAKGLPVEIEPPAPAEEIEVPEDMTEVPPAPVANLNPLWGAF